MLASNRENLGFYPGHAGLRCEYVLLTLILAQNQTKPNLTINGAFIVDADPVFVKITQALGHPKPSDIVTAKPEACWRGRS